MGRLLRFQGGEEKGLGDAGLFLAFARGWHESQGYREELRAKPKSTGRSAGATLAGLKPGALRLRGAFVGGLVQAEGGFVEFDEDFVGGRS